MFLGGVPKEASMDKAVANLQKAVELKPTHINHYHELGITYKMMGEDEKAIAQFEKVVELPQSDADDLKYKKEAAEYLEELR